MISFLRERLQQRNDASMQNARYRTGLDLDRPTHPLLQQIVSASGGGLPRAEQILLDKYYLQDCALDCCSDCFDRQVAADPTTWLPRIAAAHQQVRDEALAQARETIRQHESAIGAGLGRRKRSARAHGGVTAVGNYLFERYPDAHIENDESDDSFRYQVDANPEIWGPRIDEAHKITQAQHAAWSIANARELIRQHDAGIGAGLGISKRSARAAIVKRVMQEQRLSLPEASKYVKAHGLY